MTATSIVKPINVAMVQAIEIPLFVCVHFFGQKYITFLQAKQGRAQVQNLRPPCYKQYAPVSGSVFYSHRPLDFISAI